MNDLVVLQATQGLVRYALTQQERVRERGIVIGHDHRSGSKRFAELAANVARQEGVKVYLFQGLVHTPMVPFATSRLGAALGLMITASHNRSSRFLILDREFIVRLCRSLTDSYGVPHA